MTPKRQRKLILDDKGRKLVTEPLFIGGVVMEERPDAAGVKHSYLRGKFGVVDKPTGNGRVYPRGVIETQIQRLAPKLKEGGVFGELDHPEDGKTKLQRVSHLITDLHIEGEDVMGEAVILDTERGRDLKAIVQAGGQVGVSSRGWGDVVSDGHGNEKVTQDFELETFDVVANPAAEGANPEYVVEHKEDLVTAEELNGLSPEQIKDRFPDFYTKVVKEVREAVDKEVRADIVKVEGQVGELAASLTALKTSLAEKEGDIAHLTNVAKELGFKLYIEQNWGKRADIATVYKILGSLLAYENTEAIKVKVEALVPLLDKDAKSEVSTTAASERELEGLERRMKVVVEDIKRSRRETDKLRSEATVLRAKTADLEKANAKLDAAVKESLELSHQLGLQAYLERKLRFHPHPAKVVEALKGVQEITKAAIDGVCESLKNRGPVDSRLKGLVPPPKEGASRPSVAEESETVDDADLQLDMKSIRRLSGLSEESSSSPN